MKQVFILSFLICLFTTTLFTQVPQSFQYQAIARDKDLKPLAGANLDVEVKILRNGSIQVFTEMHDNIKTGPTGLFVLEVGSREPADFSTINWALGGYSLKINTKGGLELDIPPSPILSVPYALMAEEVRTEKQQLTLSNGNTLSITGGNSVTLPMGGTSLQPGAGIDITNNTIINKGDTNPNDDVLKTDIADGDVKGVFSNLQIQPAAVGNAELAKEAVTGDKIAQQGATNGQVLKWDDIAKIWKPENDNSTVGAGNAATSSPLTGDGSAGKPIALLPGSTSGQVLKWDGTAWTPAADETGTGASNNYTAGTGITVTGSSPNFTINNTGDTNATDDLTNTTNFGGDVSGTYNNFQIGTDVIGSNEIANGSVGSAEIADGSIGAIKIADGSINNSKIVDGTLTGSKIAQQGAANGQVLKWNGTTWAPQDDIAGGGQTTISVASPGLSITGNPATGYTLTNTGDTNATDDLTTASNFGGDLSGTYNNLQINTNAVGTNEIANGSIMLVDLAAGLIPTTLPPNGAAGNDLSGLYPNPTVARIQGQAVAPIVPTDGQVLRYNAANSRWEPATSAGSGGWNLTGNVGTDPATNFIGTKDAQPLSFRVNDTLRMKLWGNGRLELFGNPGANTFVGEGVGQLNKDGFWNTAIGSGALNRNTTGGENTATGVNVLRGNTTGGENTANGTSALYSNKTGNSNTATGKAALFSNTTGNSNVAIGTYSLFSNTTTSNLVAVGDSALYSNTSGFGNTAVGSKAGLATTEGGFNSFFGRGAGRQNISGVDNSFFGYQAGEFNKGSQNTFIGFWAGNSNVDGGQNVCIGNFARTGGNNYSNSISIGFSINAGASNTARIGNTSTTSIGGQVGWSNLSDARVKTAIVENIPGLAFIQLLRPVSYLYDTRRQNALLGITDTTQWEGKYDIEKMTFSGFLAQEVEQAARSIGYNFSGVDAPKNDKSLYGLRYAEFTVPLVKAVQEQQAMIEDQKRLIQTLETRLTALEKLLPKDNNGQKEK